MRGHSLSLALCTILDPSPDFGGFFRDLLGSPQALPSFISPEAAQHGQPQKPHDSASTHTIFGLSSDEPDAKRPKAPRKRLSESRVKNSPTAPYVHQMPTGSPLNPNPNPNTKTTEFKPLWQLQQEAMRQQAMHAMQAAGQVVPGNSRRGKAAMRPLAALMQGETLANHPTPDSVSLCKARVRRMGTSLMLACIYHACLHALTHACLLADPTRESTPLRPLTSSDIPAARTFRAYASARE